MSVMVGAKLESSNHKLVVVGCCFFFCMGHNKLFVLFQWPEDVDVKEKHLYDVSDPISIEIHLYSGETPLRNKAKVKAIRNTLQLFDKTARHNECRSRKVNTTFSIDTHL